MSISSKIDSILESRNTIRTKMVNAGQAGSNDKLSALATKLDLTTVLDYKTWLLSAGISPKDYPNLASVLADEVTVRKLMTIHASVDCILAMSSADQQTIINNDICAKWINLRDYALNTLSDHAETKALMDAAGKYGYGEWALMPQVPVMTGDSAPYGEVQINVTATSGHEAYKAFDNDDSTYCALNYPSSGTANIGYTFVEPQPIKKVRVKAAASTSQFIKTFGILGSVNGSWVNLASSVTLTLSGEYYTCDVDVNPTGQLCSAVALTIEDYEANEGDICTVNSIQFYAYAPKGNVPVMTDTDKPFGEVIYSGQGSSTNGWKAFDGDYSTWWSAGAGSSVTSNAYVGYKFVNPACIKRFVLRCWGSNNDNNTPKTLKLQASNDGSSWTDLTDIQTIQPHTSASFYTFDADNDDFYLYYRVYILTAQEGATGVTLLYLQFYGQELKVSVPKMTSNTEPWGEAFALNDNHGYYLFNDDITGYLSANDFGYHFPFSVNVKKIKFQIRNGSPSGSGMDTSIIVKGSNDGTNWDSVKTVEILGINFLNVQEIDLSGNKNAYKYWKIYFTSDDYSIGNQLTMLQFYGFDYSEYDWDADTPRHYLYDHGVEFDRTISNATPSAGILEKKPSSLYAKLTDISAGVWIQFTPNDIDLSNYDLLRACIGDRLIPNALIYPCPDAYKIITNYMDEVPYNGFVDISGISQDGQICISLGSLNNSYAEMELTEYWLE